MIPRPFALAPLLAAALAAMPARADDATAAAPIRDADLRSGSSGVSAEAVLHSRLTSTASMPRTDVLYDPATRAFDLDGYLVPEHDDAYGSVFASVALDGRGLGGDLRWRLAVDTGELRRRTFHRTLGVCLVSTGTGLAPPSECLAGRVPVVSTLEADPVVTSNARPLEEEVEATALVREAYASLAFGRARFASVWVGRRRTSIADGLVYDDYATGAELALDLGAIGPPLELRAAVFQPTRDLPRRAGDVGPVVALRLDWLPSLFERAGVFVAAHRDRSGSTAELFRGAIVERIVGYLAQALPGTTGSVNASHLLARTLAAPLDSDARLLWAGTSGDLLPWRGQRLSWTAAVAAGRVDDVEVSGAPIPPLADEITVRGRMLSVRWGASVDDRLWLGASFLYLSGGEFPRAPAAGETAAGTYRGFLGIAPFVSATNLFFGGGLSESFASRQTTAPGVNGRGVAAPGVDLSYDPTSTLGLDARVAWLRAPVAGPFGGNAYGAEVDLNLSWKARSWLFVGLEADALWPGDFYAGRETVYKTVIALDLVTP